MQLQHGGNQALLNPLWVVEGLRQESFDFVI
jgi:hypothetical protein